MIPELGPGNKTTKQKKFFFGFLFFFKQYFLGLSLDPTGCAQGSLLAVHSRIAGKAGRCYRVWTAHGSAVCKARYYHTGPWFSLLKLVSLVGGSNSSLAGGYRGLEVTSG